MISVVAGGGSGEAGYFIVDVENAVNFNISLTLVNCRAQSLPK